MHITTVRLRNWCQHSTLDVEFRAGLNGILGTNGRGKSNLLDAMRFAITGESINPGTKTDNLKHGAEKGYVELTFEAGDTEYTIRRAIESSKVSLKFDETTISKQAEVEEFLVRLLGANMDTLLDNVFIPQGKIDSILYARASDRLKEFQQTFGLNQAAEAHKWLTQEANAYQVTTGLDEQLQTATQLVLTSQQELDTLDQQITARKAEIAQLEPAEKVIQQALEATRTAAAIQHADRLVEEAIAEVQRLSPEGDKAAEELKRILKALETMKPQAEAAQSQIQQIEQAVSQYGQAEHLRNELAAAQKALQELNQPGDESTLARLRQAVVEFQVQHDSMKAIVDGRAPLPSLPVEQTLKDEKASLLAEFKQAIAIEKMKSPELVRLEMEYQRATNHLLAAEKGQCPTCNQAFAAHVPDLQNECSNLRKAISLEEEKIKTDFKQLSDRIGGRITQIDAELAKLEQMARDVVKVELDVRRSRLQGAQQELAEMTAKITAFNDALRKRDLLAAQLQGAPQQKPDEAPLAALRDFLGQYQQLIESHRQADYQWRLLGQQRQAATAACTNALTLRSQLGDTIAMPSQQDLETAKQQAVALGLARTALAELGQNFGIAKACAEQRTAQVTHLREQLNREAKDASWVSEVRKVRDVLHVTNLPALMMREYARILNIRIEHYLTVWEAPFRMWLADDMSFRVRFEDGMEIDAARLSGGQKIVASASFRLAMSDTFARSVGLLVFDEPSTYLDKDNIQHLQTLLLKLKEMSQHSGRQILVVTHEESLMSFLDHVVTV
jgi:DNA repair exonuclease SbcCD ATPase subunit